MNLIAADSIQVTAQEKPASGVEQYLERISVDPVNALDACIPDIGYGPQRQQLIGVVISGVSAAAGTPVNIHLAGDFAEGKTTVARAAADIVGPDFVVSSGSLQKMTAAAAARMAENITGRCTMFDERCRGDHEFDSMLRMVSSGHAASRTITMNGAPVELTIRPPVAIVEAVLANKEIAPPDRSRYLRLRMSSHETTREQITLLNAQRYTLEGVDRKLRYDMFTRAFQLLLARLRRNLKVIVPFATDITLETHSPIRDRLLSNVLNATCTVAWLRQEHRPRDHSASCGEYIIADVEDYEVIHSIVMACGEDGSDDVLPDNALNLFRVWSGWVRVHGNRGIARNAFDQIANGQLRHWQVYRALRCLADAGYAKGPTGRGTMGHWYLTDLGLASDHPNLFGALPTPEQLRASRKAATLPDNTT